MELSPCLPSQDGDPAALTRDIQQSREMYGWTRSLIPGAGMPSVVLQQERPSRTWRSMAILAVK